jgi:hypothetical protein
MSSVALSFQTVVAITCVVGMVLAVAAGFWIHLRLQRLTQAQMKFQNEVIEQIQLSALNVSINCNLLRSGEILVQGVIEADLERLTMRSVGAWLDERGMVMTPKSTEFLYSDGRTG